VLPAAGGEVRVSLRWSADPEGYLVGAPPHPAWHDVVLGHVLATLRPPAQSARFAFQVRVQAGANPAVRLERSVLCGPIKAQNFSPPPGVGLRPFAPSPIPGARPEPVRAKVRISAEGAVTAVTILSSSGYPEIDREVVTRSKAQHYRPALLDGRPVAVWISADGIRLGPLEIGLRM
jgi:TonB family protein